MGRSLPAATEPLAPAVPALRSFCDFGQLEGRRSAAVGRSKARLEEEWAKTCDLGLAAVLFCTYMCLWYMQGIESLREVASRSLRQLKCWLAAGRKQLLPLLVMLRDAVMPLLLLLQLCS
jgi:hypothetical protein